MDRYYIIETNVDGGEVREVSTYDSWERAVDRAVETARANEYLAAQDLSEDVFRTTLNTDGTYTDGGVRITVRATID